MKRISLSYNFYYFHAPLCHATLSSTAWRGARLRPRLFPRQPLSQALSPLPPLSPKRREGLGTRLFLRDLVTCSSASGLINHEWKWSFRKKIRHVKFPVTGFLRTRRRSFGALAHSSIQKNVCVEGLFLVVWTINSDKMTWPTHCSILTF